MAIGNVWPESFSAIDRPPHHRDVPPSPQGLTGAPTDLLAGLGLADFDTLPDPVVCTDASGMIVGWNRAAETLFGYTAREALGARLAIVPPEEEERADAFRARVMHGETIDAIEIEGRNKTGERLTLLLSAAPWRIGREIVGTLTTFKNLSAQKARERELMRQIACLQARADALEAEARRKDDFLATVSHELRTPLTAILGFAHIIVENDGLGAARRRGMAEDIVASGGLLLTQVNDLLDIVQLGTGRLTVPMETVDLSSVVRWCERTVRALMSSKGLQFDRAIPTDLPPVRANTARLQQVLLNFLVNAYKFTPTGGTVTLSAREERGAVSISVRDTGIGIAPEHAARIFEPFERVETEYTRTQSGAGVGLAVARQLVDLMGGAIDLESAIDVGSAFTVTLKSVE